jgi:hypothetical protein
MSKRQARMAIKANRGEKTPNQRGSHFGVHPAQIAQEIFEHGGRKDRADEAEKEHSTRRSAG